MSFLPKGFGMQVADAEATIARQQLKMGDYVFLHRRIFEKKTKKGDAVIIEHRIVEAKKIVADVEPTPVGTNWGYFLPKYGDAAVMLLPNLKAYLLGILGINEKNITKQQLGEAFDRMGGEEQACRGMLVRGITFKTETRAGEDFVGTNWTPIVGENIMKSDNVLKRRAEVDAELGEQEQAQQQQQQQAQQPQGIQVVQAMPSIPAAAAGVHPNIAVAMQQGWQRHSTPGYWWHPALPQGQNVKTETDILAGR